MGERTSYEPGVFCWVELATTDGAGAGRFYSGLLGWEVTGQPMPGGGEYLVARLQGHDVAGGYEQDEGQRAGGVPPHWLSYVSVDDVEAAAERVRAAGGTVVMEPVDVMGAGMCVAADPQGAVFGIWQPGPDMIGAGLVNQPGALSFNQLNTSDPEGATAFYGSVFGWEMREAPAEGGPYWGIYVGEHMNGGMMPLMPEMQAPPHWLAYFTSDDLDAAAARVAELGGRVMVPPMAIGPDARIVVARDPQGAYFALYEGPVDP